MQEFYLQLQNLKRTDKYSLLFGSVGVAACTALQRAKRFTKSAAANYSYGQMAAAL